MIYLIKGDESYLIQKKVKSLVKAAGGQDDWNVHYYDGNEKTFSVEQMLEDCLSIPFLAEKNVVVVKDPVFLVKKLEEERLTKELLKYIEKPSYETDLILYNESVNFNTILKVYKELIKNAQVFEFAYLKPYDFEKACKEEILKSGLSIDAAAASYLIESSTLKLERFFQSLEKLSLYPGKIDLSCAKALIDRPLEDDGFKLINAITAKNISLALHCLDDLYLINPSPFPIIALLASQLRYLYHVAYFNDLHRSLYDIASETKSKEFRVQMALITLSHIRKIEIMAMLDALSRLDLSFKSEDGLDPKSQIELFILRLVRGQYASH